MSMGFCYMVYYVNKIKGEEVKTVWENKNREIFFLACLLVIRENLCSRKFPAIRYFQTNNFAGPNFHDRPS